MINLQALYKEYEDDNHIDSSLYAKYRVKSGLRNENGTGVKVGLTKISDVVGYEYSNGNKVHIDGRLIYRGYDIDDLVSMRKDTPFGFELSAFLLIYGKLPTHRQLLDFHKELIKMADAHNVDIHYQTSNLLNAIQIEVLKLYGEDIDPDSDTLEERMLKGMYILASMPLLMLSHYKKEKITHYPLPDKGIAENVLCIIRQNTHYTQKEASLLDILFMLHADHGGGNNSTFTNVVISSTGTDIYSSFAGAIGSLKGPKHGGANLAVMQQMLLAIDEIGIEATDQEIENIVEKILDKQFNDNSGLIYGIANFYRLIYLAGSEEVGGFYFEAAAMILTLITLGKYLEAKSTGRTGDAIKRLLNLTPDTAVIEYNGEEQDITVYWDVEEFLYAGNYRVDIFADGNLIGSQPFILD